MQYAVNSIQYTVFRLQCALRSFIMYFSNMI